MTDLEAKARELLAERDQARQIVRDIHWMARRYADGRKTYAPSMFNKAVRPAFEAGWLEPLNNGGEPEYARDGDFDKEYAAVEARLSTALDRIRVLEEALERVLTWWPEGSENGRLNKGGSFATDLQAARQALSHREDGATPREKARGL